MTTLKGPILRLTVINLSLGTSYHHVGSEAEINHFLTSMSDPMPSEFCTSRTPEGSCGCHMQFVVKELGN